MFDRFIKTSGAQKVYGVKTFKDGIVVPDNTFSTSKINGLTTYVNALITAKTGIKSIDYVDIYVDQIVAGIKTFTNGIIVPDGSLPLSAINGFVSNSYVDMTSTQTITGDKTFTGAVNVPDNTFPTRVIGGLSTAINAVVSAALTYYVDLTSTQTISGDKTFTGAVQVPDNSFTSSAISDIATKYVDVTNTQTVNGDKTFTGNATFIGNVQIGDASSDTITLISAPTLRSNLNLPVNPYFSTPASGQLGYIITGTLATDGSSLTSTVVFNVATVSLPAGVWFLSGRVYVTASATAGSLYTRAYGLSTTSSSVSNNGIRNGNTLAIGASSYLCEAVSNVVTVTGASNVTYYLNVTLNFGVTSFTLNAGNSSLIAVRIA